MMPDVSDVQVYQNQVNKIAMTPDIEIGLRLEYTRKHAHNAMLKSGAKDVQHTAPSKTISKPCLHVHVRCTCLPCTAL